MKLSMEQAAIVIGKSKKTIYNHKDRNKFSYEHDNDGKATIDASELLRVYGSTPEITKRLEELQSPTQKEGSVNTQTYNEKKRSKRSDDEIIDYKMKLVKLEAELDKEKALKQKAEDDVEYFKEALNKSQETAQKVTLLLDDKRDRAGDWEQNIKKLEERISNQETLTDENSKLKNKLDEREKAFNVQKEELEEEKSKGFWKRMFG